MNGDIGCSAFGDWVWRCRHILALLVVLKRLQGIRLDRLDGISKEARRR